MHVEPLNIGLAVIIGVSFVGFGLGVAKTERLETPLRPTAAAVSADAEVPTARSYSELRALGPNHRPDSWTADALALTEGLPGRDAEGTPSGDKQDALAARAARRAYDGAPPTIPHPVRQRSAAECLACHDSGALLRGRTASAMSHESLASCTQCHVVEAAPMPSALWLTGGPWGVENSFVGKASAESGERAWSVAPPVIPHQTFMRERCESCHGVSGSDPIRTTHPYRQSCPQCHAVSATKDMRPGAFAEPEQQ